MPENPSGIDRFLQALVINANRNGDGLLITVNVGGLLVSGRVIGEREYVDLYGRQGLGFTSDEDIASLESVFRKSADSDLYIHLGDARILAPTGQLLSVLGGVWRGKLSAVDGFFLGALGK
ncbi:MAG TPA: hypothetical protein V6D10_20635 [Trichocoleus sp.]|jgi:hypothetical protein